MNYQDVTTDPSSSEFHWPPPYRLKRSARARSPRLQISTRGGLEVILPKRFKIEEVTNVLTQHKHWIERTWKRLKPPTTPVEVEPIPQRLDLLAIQEHWQIEYRLEPIESVRIKEHPAKNLDLFSNAQSIFNENKLLVTGNINNTKLIKKALEKWLKKTAALYLTAWMQRVSQQTGLVYEGLKFRSGTSRWGSCSAKKNITLNLKLLFLPAHLVEHVLLHELCHTKHLNHSRKFWDLVKSFDPNCHTSRKELKLAQNKIPLWLE